MNAALPPAARAFDAIAPRFDERFSQWASVAAQRRPVRAALEATFAQGSRLLEIGGGTGEDALWLAKRGRQVVMTDIAPAMVAQARAKFAGHRGLVAQVCAAERLAGLGQVPEGGFDGAWSNFAALNCVEDLRPTGRALARLIRPGGAALLVVFGTFSPGEIVVEGLRGRPGAMLRRLQHGPVAARLGGEAFTVTYHRRKAIEAALGPWFNLRQRQGIGVFVPPSAAEPWISRNRRFLAFLERLDRGLSKPLAGLGDHVLYHFVRNNLQVHTP